MTIRFLLKAIWRIVGLLLIIPAVLIAICARRVRKPIDIGLGPHPLINNIYHKAALRRYGYTAETFVTSLYYITADFDRILLSTNLLVRALLQVVALNLMIFRYRCIYLYFDGGPFGQDRILWRFEALLLKLAGVRIVLMPYGSDVQDMSLSHNLNFKHAYSRQYKKTLLKRKRIAARIDYWSRNASHIISGCEWVDYMHVWDTLMLAHFSIDTEKWRPTGTPRTKGSFKILHAPNHRHMKGSQYIIDAVEELRTRGMDIELVLLERVSNEDVRAKMKEVDVVADQLIIGWYAMFALEGMAMGKPVLCYLRDDLKDLYITAGLVEPGELPIVECRPDTVKETIERLYRNREKLDEIGRRSRAFVERHHSLEAVGSVFDRINRSIGIAPSGTPANTAGERK